MILKRLQSLPALQKDSLYLPIRDLLMHSMQTLSHCFIVAHVHDEMIIEADRRMSVQAVCQQMSKTPAWAEGLILRADGFECEYYRKE